MPDSAPSGRPRAVSVASGSVPSESSTRGTCRRRSSRVVRRRGARRPARAAARRPAPGARLGQVEEEDVVGRRSSGRAAASACADELELRADRRERDDQQVLRASPADPPAARARRSGEGDHPAPQPPRRPGRGDQRRRPSPRPRRRAAGERRVRGQVGVVEPQVVGDDAEMWLGSSDQRGMPRSISATARCPYRRRKPSTRAAPPVAGAPPGSAGPAAGTSPEPNVAADVRIVGAEVRRQLPQLEVHLGGHVVRQPAQHGLQLARWRVRRASRRARPSSDKPERRVRGTILGMIRKTSRPRSRSTWSSRCAGVASAGSVRAVAEITFDPADPARARPAARPGPSPSGSGSPDRSTRTRAIGRSERPAATSRCTGEAGVVERAPRAPPRTAPP